MTSTCGGGCSWVTAILPFDDGAAWVRRRHLWDRRWRAEGPDTHTPVGPDMRVGLGPAGYLLARA